MFIIGGNGSIGTNLRILDNKNFFSGSSFSKKPIKNAVAFDLMLDDPEDFVKKNHGDLKSGVILLAAMSDPDLCYQQRRSSQLINFEKICGLISCLDNYGVYFVFASTEFVFDGNEGQYSETDVANPILLYGKQKKSVEDFIIENELFGCALRFPKVYWAADGGETLLTKAVAELTSGSSAIKVASDQIMTPLFGEDLFDVLEILSAKKITGVLHCGGPLEISRFDLYSDIKKFFLMKGTNVKVQLRECSIHEFKSPERRPENTSLNSSKLFDILGRTTRSHLDILEALYGND